MSRFLSFVLAVCAALAASPASAQDPAFYLAERLRPSLDRDGILDVESGGVGEHLNYDVALWLNYERNPLVIVQPSAGRVGHVAHRFTSHLTGSLSLFDWVEVGAEVPLALYQTRDPGATGTLSAFATGDFRLMPKLRVLRASDQLIDLALIPAVSAPSSMPVRTFFGAGGFSFLPEVALSTAIGGFRVATNVGYALRPDQAFLGTSLGPDATVRLGLAYRFHDVVKLPLEIDASGYFATRIIAPITGDLTQSPSEATLGAKYDITSSLQLFGFAGLGLTGGIGSPDVRAGVGARFGARTSDKDHDGVDDRDDACRDEAEDNDGFADSDGCPDNDNDGDGVGDSADACPIEPGSSPARGCPDRDSDGVRDTEDACADDAGPFTTLGCPDGDRDGIADAKDKCPAVAGTADHAGCGDKDGDGVFDDGADICVEQPGPAATKGCPDGDGDGISDRDDECPKERGALPQMGCPDSDGDGLVDRLDNCPKEHGPPDNAGCQVKQLVTITKEKIIIKDKVFFQTGKAVIDKRSHPLLDNIAQVLVTHSEIAKLRVEGHTDDVGKPDKNRALSQERADAVRTYLTGKAIDAARLEAVGFGPDKPVVANDSDDNRAQNRRVEFVIVEQ